MSMEIAYGLDDLTRDDTSVVTVGTFDGVHRGHQRILNYLRDRARQIGGRSVAVSFNPHPREVVHGVAVPLLTTIDERAILFRNLGLDRFVVIPFTEAFSGLSAEAFVEDILVRKIGLREIVVGPDHGFGKGRGGDAGLLRALGERHSFSVDVIPKQVVSEVVVSSTEIRRLLEDDGAVQDAERLLGRRYSLVGTVVPGARRGRVIGFPTANIMVNHPRKVVPLNGVYAVRVSLESGEESLVGMMNIGRRPTFEGEGLHLEVHLLDFDGDLYGTQLRVEFVERLRDEQKFDSVEALIEQLSKDRARCMAAVKSIP